MNTLAAIRMKGIDKSFKNVEVLRGVDVAPDPSPVRE